jgi:hypothetical protein
LPLSRTSAFTDSPLLPLPIVRFVKLGQIQCHGTTRIRSHVLANANETLASFVEHVLETDHNTLKVRLTSLLDVVAYFAEID